MDYDALLLPIEGDNPSGQDLRNDARFHAIERLFDPAARGLRSNQDGTPNAGAALVDWDKIASDGQALATEGRDLRLLVKLLRASFAIDGFEGLTDGFDVLVRTLEQHWDDLHPELRESDAPADQVQRRLNALKQIENDENGLLGDLKCTVILTPRGIGPLTGEDLEIGTLRFFDLKSRYSGATASELEEHEAKHEARVNRVRAGTRAIAAETPEAMAKMMDQVIAAQEKAGAVCAAFCAKAKLDTAGGLSLPETVEMLSRIQKTLEAASADTQEEMPQVPAPNGMDKPTTTTSSTGSTAQNGATNGAANGAMSQTIASRRDVEHALEGIIAFYERTEPSSPIPHLAQRMHRMVSMDFLELMEEIAPAGMKEFRAAAGLEDAKKK